jgi:hypothetical protein
MIGQLILAVVLVAGGAVLWGRGAEIDRRAGAQRALVTLQYGRAAGAGTTSAAAAYWTGDYAAVGRDADPLLAANAAYRAVMAEGGDARTVVTKLDDIARRYADVMREEPSNEDAAYNYEFVVRYRAVIAARGAAMPPSSPDAGLTPHGHAGAAPSGGDGKQFKLIVPMRPDERREAEEAGRAGRRIRKG